MKSFFARHEVDKEAEGFNQGEEGFPSNGRIAWDLWGGDSGKSRSEKIVKQMDSADEKEVESVLQKAGSRISQATKSEMNEIKADLEEICETDGIPRSVYILAEHALSKLNYLMGDEEKQFEDVKRKFFAFMANADISTLRNIKTTVNLITDASESEEDKRAWHELLASF